VLICSDCAKAGTAMERANTRDAARVLEFMQRSPT
jgi:hypothetical protein